MSQPGPAPAEPHSEEPGGVFPVFAATDDDGVVISAEEPTGADRAWVLVGAMTVLSQDGGIVPAVAAAEPGSVSGDAGRAADLPAATASADLLRQEAERVGIVAAASRPAADTGSPVEQDSQVVAAPDSPPDAETVNLEQAATGGRIDPAPVPAVDSPGEALALDLVAPENAPGAPDGGAPLPAPETPPPSTSEASPLPVPEASLLPTPEAPSLPTSEAPPLPAPEVPPPTTPEAPPPTTPEAPPLPAPEAPPSSTPETALPVEPEAEPTESEVLEPDTAASATPEQPVETVPELPAIPFDPIFGLGGGRLSATLVDSFILPDSAVAAGHPGGFTCTGLDRNVDGSWIIANDGRTELGDTSHEPSIEFLDAGFGNSIGHIALAPLYEGIESVQGVCLDRSDGTIWFVDRANAMIRHIDQDGTPLREDDIDVGGIVPNGLAYDSTRGGLWVSTAGTQSAYCLSTKDGSLLATVRVKAGTDHLFYDADFDRLYFTYGANGREGSISAIDVATDTLIGGYHGLEKAQAIEGLYIDGDTFYLANDAGFHSNARPSANMVLEFRLGDVFADVAAGDTGGDVAFAGDSGVSAGAPFDPDPFGL